MSHRKRAGMTPTQFAEYALYKRSLEVLYEILDKADERGLQQTVRALNHVQVALILLHKKDPNRHPWLHVEALPINV